MSLTDSAETPLQSANLTTRKDLKDLNINSNDSDTSSVQLNLVSFRICQVILPVTLCSLYVVILIRILEWATDRSANVINNTWNTLGLGVNQDLSFSKTLLNNTIIVGVFLLLIALVTTVILLVFYMEWHGCLGYYFYVPSFIIMAILTPIYFKEILASLNWFGVDLITLVIINWNFVALGMVAIFEVYTKGPLLVQQFYLLHNSAIMAVVILKALPSWAPWMLLGFLVFWDLFAVLAPYGPLNLIISMAEREGIVEMPGLVYATDTISTSHQRQEQQQQQVQPQQPASQETDQNRKPTTSASDPGPSSVKQANTIEEGLTGEPEVGRQVADQQAARGERAPHTRKQTSIQEKGVSIGLGDFIFYSLLVGLNAKGRRLEDFYAVLASLDAILVGLVLTLVILAVSGRALPALPISIALGLIVSVATVYFVPSLANGLAAEQIFV